MKQFFSFLTVLMAVLVVTSCEFEEPKEFVPDDSDASGNLLIINNSNERLVLYKDEYLVKKVPASATDYLVNIPNADEASVQLDIYLWDDVKDDINNPDPSAVYKRWLVPLSGSTDVETRSTWHIGMESDFTDVATVSFSYFGGTSYNADVYLNDKSGAKLLSLKPGDQYKKVGIDYGNYSILYRYWYSNPDDNQAIDEDKTVWVTKENINGQETDIWMVLNENRNEVTYIVPHNGVDTEKKSYYAYITITNMHYNPVVINNGDKLIEYTCFLDGGNKTNYSTISSSGKTTYVMPITDVNTLEETFILTARDLQGSWVESTSFTLTEGETAYWTVDGLDDTTDEVVEEPVEEPVPSDTTAVDTI